MRGAIDAEADVARIIDLLHVGQPQPGHLGRAAALDAVAE